MQTEVLTLRSGKLDDLAEMQQLYVDTITTICTKDYNKKQLQVWAAGVKNKQRWLAIFENQYVIVAQKGSKIVGYGTLENGSYIDLLFIHKDFQRQGIADQLLNALENKAIKLNSPKLTSNVSKTAKGLFERKGFQVIQEQNNLIKGVEIVNYKMFKNLNQVI
ncbi:GNAT family N-acetyltransferase [Adhaeribacter radiodurans]|uniref:GNAT family N-acetyltransferase n=1 Tax=Adhaeribacter radiodurans TaxID=2745197 RepID=A0A7L7LCR3_9BACT|nr:GNAT family N-acetyltransferase [Adhaeribacter radiodurans]QMU30628.1 GNAT family N-acetyltransferase [Adhaeribacter radiodurans]